MQSTILTQTWNTDAISVAGLQLAMGSKQLLTNSDFKISKKDRICLLGRNGCGKSSLFHWICHQAQTQEQLWSVHEVAQELPPTDQSICQVVLSAHLLRGNLWQRQNELERIETMSDTEIAEYKSIGEQLASMSADADPPRVRKILAGLGFQESDMNRPLSTFSGGWRARVALAQGLFMEPDLLLLDEPTNHLDLEAILWLQEFCVTWRKTLLIISHNVGFIRNIATTIWDIQSKNINQYNCTYNLFLKQKQLYMKKQEKDWANLEKEVTALRKKGTPQAKKAAEELLKKRQKEGVQQPDKHYSPKFILHESEPYNGSTALLKIEDGVLGYDPENPILKNVTFALYPGYRVALIGKNGSGKSTFLKALQGSLPVQCSTYKQAGLRVCTFDQHFYNTVPEDLTPIQWLSSLIPRDAAIRPEHIRKILGASGLEGVAHTIPIGLLSGGQKSRVHFASISIMSPDILLLDEVTNHLDIETIAGLIETLKEFPGAIILVSHDMDFLEELAKEVWIIEDGTLTQLGENEDGLEMYADSIMNAMKS